MQNFAYPPTPQNVLPEKLQPSAAFKKQVAKVIVSIVWFFAVYLLLVVGAVLLAVGCCYLGVLIIAAMPKLITLLAGLGLMAVGVSVIFFLIKFIFSVSKNENPNRVQITEQEQPELFAFIRQLSKETNTAFPKKIFVSPDVNACVFYNSSFWSMFFPVRKNLEIGFGLVNSINISELKAVIAHEFGHFSQRSMKLGSFTYNVNRIIYNMLYENTGYGTFLNSWASIDGVLSFFAAITIKIAEGIQYILRQMYKLINKNYMSLSREMEFHADAVAASVAGGNNVISGLSRIEVAAGCYNTAVDNADELLKQKRCSANIFDNQLAVFRNMANRYKLPVRQGLPEVSFEFVHSFSKSRINYKDQWASHPELAERKAHLDKLDIQVLPDETSAWVVFNNTMQLQEQLTQNLYRNIKNGEAMEKMDSGAYAEWYENKNELYRLPEVYNGYYDSRFVELKDLEVDDAMNTRSLPSLEQLFTTEKAALNSFINNNERDLQIVKAIKEKQIDVNSFDFDGQKFSATDCDQVIAQLEQEITSQKQELQQADKQAYCFFYGYNVQVKADYASFNQASEKYQAYITDANAVINCIQPFYYGQLQLEQINGLISELKNKHELRLKARLKELMEEGIINKEQHSDLHNDVQVFLEKFYHYFMANEFQNDELNKLRQITVEVAGVLYDYKFAAYKKMLEAQLAYYNALSQNSLHNVA
ncbi:M48 family metallopeptidase [Foetidibacter luteolus]|uniref:M48 family metallopeptidase n=1 Tax=Foetidibacter luteolus TaxID=2608880 RepID=UPI00129C0A3D|nr:M48 family metallopeptidase [Foetidibacter luteolus]